MPKQLENNGLTEKDIKFNKNIFYRNYQILHKEAGVRNLERDIKNM